MGDEINDLFDMFIEDINDELKINAESVVVISHRNIIKANIELFDDEEKSLGVYEAEIEQGEEGNFLLDSRFIKANKIKVEK
jgi:hypothetical protein